MENKGLPLNPETLALHMASTSHRSPPKTPSEHSKSVYSESSRFFKEIQVIKRDRDVQSTNGDVCGRFTNLETMIPKRAQKTFNDYWGLPSRLKRARQVEESGHASEAGSIEETADALPDVATQFWQAAEALTALRTETASQTGILRQYLERRATLDAEVLQSLHSYQSRDLRHTIPGSSVVPATEVEGGGMQPPHFPPGVRGSAGHPPDSSGEARPLPEVEVQSEVGSSGGSEEQVGVARVNESGLQGRISYTQDLRLFTKHGRMVSFGAQATFPIDGNGFQSPRFSFVCNIRGGMEGFSPVMTDGKGWGQKLELSISDCGFQFEQGVIVPDTKERYQYHRAAISLPVSNQDNELALNQFLPFRISGFDPCIKFQKIRVQPYLLHVENQGFTGGGGLEIIRGFPMNGRPLIFNSFSILAMISG